MSPGFGRPGSHSGWGGFAKGINTCKLPQSSRKAACRPALGGWMGVEMILTPVLQNRRSQGLITPCSVMVSSPLAPLVWHPCL